VVTAAATPLPLCGVETVTVDHVSPVVCLRAAVAIAPHHDWLIIRPL